MRIPVIGGTGFIGRAILRSLASAGHHPIALHRGRTESSVPGVEHRHLDRHDQPRLTDALADAPIIVDVTAMTRTDAQEVYRDRGGVVLRLGFVIGPHDRQRREEPILRRVRAGRTEMPIGAGTFVGSRVFVDDVAAAVTCAAEASPGDVAGEAFNVVEERSPNFGLWARWIVADAEADLQLTRVPDRYLPIDLQLFGTMPQPLLFSSSKAREVLGWRPTDPREATRRSVRWHLAHPPAEAGNLTADDDALRRAR